MTPPLSLLLSILLFAASTAACAKSNEPEPAAGGSPTAPSATAAATADSPSSPPLRIPAASAAALADPIYRSARLEMVDETMRQRDIRDPRVLEAMRNVPRHEFVPADVRSSAHIDGPLPIGHGQTISQPYIVALMTQLLKVKPTDEVLEIGTGSGYQAAVLSLLAGEVYTIEIVDPLGRRAAQDLKRLGYDNVHVRIGDGYLGWPERAPFDKILLTAAPEKIPQPLIDQLAVGGLMVAPVGPTDAQEIVVLEKTAKGIVRKKGIPVRFVPMTGKAERER